MNVVFHAHRAEVPMDVQQRAEEAVRKLGSRLPRAVDASVRFATDGPRRRVEVEMRTPRRPAFVGTGEAWQYDEALTQAMAALEAHVAHARAARARQLRRGAPDAASLGLLPTAGDDGEERLDA